MPRKVSEIMNIFADKGSKVGDAHHDKMPDKNSVLSEPWIMDGIYYPPSNYFMLSGDGDPRNEMELWWTYDYYDDASYSYYYGYQPGPNSGTHVAGYMLNEALWNVHEPKFRDALKRLSDVANDRGTWSTSYEKGTLTRIAREVNQLQMDLMDFVDGPGGGGGLKKHFDDLNLSEEGGFKGTAAGALGNRIYELASRLQDMYEQLDDIDAPLSRIYQKDGINQALSNLETEVYAWYNNEASKTKNILYDWYRGTTLGSQTWNADRDQFQITIDDNGTTGIPTDGDDRDDDTTGVTTDNIHAELNRRWNKHFQGVEDAANNLFETMQEVYKDTFKDLRIFTPPEGDPLPGYTSSGTGGNGGGGGGGNVIPEDIFDGIFDDVFPEGMFDDMFPKNMFDNVFPEDMFDNMFPENMFDDMFPKDMFDNMFPEDFYDQFTGPGGGGMDGPGGGGGSGNFELPPGFNSGPGGGGFGGSDNPGGSNYFPPPGFNSGPGGSGFGGSDNPGGSNYFPPPGFNSGPGGSGFGGSDNPGNTNYPPAPDFNSGPGGSGFGGPGSGNEIPVIPQYPGALPPSGPGGSGFGGLGPNGNTGRERPVLETDPQTGLPIDPETGEPFPVDPESGIAYDPDTGLPVATDPETGELLPINPMTGEPFDPQSEMPVLETDPETGLPINPETGAPFPVDPESGIAYDPDTGLPVATDPETGEVLPIDPMTGLPEGYGSDSGLEIPEYPQSDIPETDQPEIPYPETPDYPEIPDSSSDSGIDLPPTSSNGGQGPQSTDRSSLFSGPSNSNGGPGGSSLSQYSGPGESGFGNNTATQQSPTGPGGSPGTGGSGLGGGTGGGGLGGNQMSSQMGGTGMGNGMMPPMMPPMGGMGGMGGGGQNNRERERTTWLSEDERVWGTSANRNGTVLGRPAPGADKRSAQRNEFVDAGGERTRTGTSAEDAPRSGGRKRKPGVGNRGGRRQEQAGGGEGERER